MGHGSNTKQMRTTSTYDPSTQEFVIHTPDFQAAKCWIGNLGEFRFNIYLHILVVMLQQQAYSAVVR